MYKYTNHHEDNFCEINFWSFLDENGELGFSFTNSNYFFTFSKYAKSCEDAILFLFIIWFLYWYSLGKLPTRELQSYQKALPEAVSVKAPFASSSNNLLARQFNAQNAANQSAASQPMTPRRLNKRHSKVNLMNLGSGATSTRATISAAATPSPESATTSTAATPSPESATTSTAATPSPESATTLATKKVSSQKQKALERFFTAKTIEETVTFTAPIRKLTPESSTSEKPITEIPKAEKSDSSVMLERSDCPETQQEQVVTVKRSNDTSSSIEAWFSVGVASIRDEAVLTKLWEWRLDYDKEYQVYQAARQRYISAVEALPQQESGLQKLSRREKIERSAKINEHKEAHEEFLKQSDSLYKARNKFEDNIRYQQKVSILKADPSAPITLSEYENNLYKKEQTDKEQAPKKSPSKTSSDQTKFDIMRLKKDGEDHRYMNKPKIAETQTLRGQVLYPNLSEAVRDRANTTNVGFPKVCSFIEYEGHIKDGVRHMAQVLSKSPNKETWFQEGQNMELKLGPLSLRRAHKLQVSARGEQGFTKEVRATSILEDVRNKTKNETDDVVINRRFANRERELNLARNFLNNLYEKTKTLRPKDTEAFKKYLSSPEVLDPLVGFRGDFSEDIALIMGSNQATREKLGINIPVIPYYINESVMKLNTISTTNTNTKTEDFTKLSGYTEGWKIAQDENNKTKYPVSVHHRKENSQGGADLLSNASVFSKFEHFFVHAADEVDRMLLKGKAPIRANRASLGSFFTSAATFFQGPDFAAVIPQTKTG